MSCLRLELEEQGFLCLGGYGFAGDAARPHLGMAVGRSACGNANIGKGAMARWVPAFGNANGEKAGNGCGGVRIRKCERGKVEAQLFVA